MFNPINQNLFPFQTVFEELERTEKWASTHVSDHCGFHYRQFLLSHLHNKPSLINNQPLSSTNTENLLDNPCQNNEASMVLKNDSVDLSFDKAIRKELDFLGSLQIAYPGHEALWYHRRYILQEIGKLGTVYSKSNGNIQEDSGPSTSLGLKVHTSSKVKSEAVYDSGLNLECANTNHPNSKNVTHLQSHIEDIHSVDVEDVEVVSMEVSGQCEKDKMSCAIIGQDRSSADRSILSSLGDIHSLVLDDTEFTEGITQCKRCKMEGDSTGQEQVKGEIHSNNLEFGNVCTVDNETGETVSNITSECKRCKLDCATVGQGLKSEQSRTDINSSLVDIHSLRNNDIEITPMEGSGQYKAQKIAFSSTIHELELEQNANTSHEVSCCSDSSNSKIKISKHSKSHTLPNSSAQHTTISDCTTSKEQHRSILEVWSLLEEDCFLKKLLAKSREGGWEQTLIQRHIVWLSRTLKWSLMLS